MIRSRTPLPGRQSFRACPTGTGRFSQAFSNPCRIFCRSNFSRRPSFLMTMYGISSMRSYVVKRRLHFRHSRRRRIRSPVRASRESITLSSRCEQNGHFTEASRLDSHGALCVCQLVQLRLPVLRSRAIFRSSPMDQPSRNSSGNPTKQHPANVISQIRIDATAAGFSFYSKYQSKDKESSELRRRLLPREVAPPNQPA